jgi:ATP-dependent protease HslVU (ClpYQ) peptidase subunit
LCIVRWADNKLSEGEVVQMDTEYMRYEAAKSAMAALIQSTDLGAETIATLAVEYADDLLAALKATHVDTASDTFSELSVSDYSTTP